VASVQPLCAALAFTYVASAEKATALASEIETAERTPLAIRADSTDPAAVKAAVTQTVERFGRLDILVNNAGILLRGLVDELDLGAFDRIIAVNVRAVFVAGQAALPHMGQGGRIINSGSVAADRSGFPGSSIYSMTKAAVAALTRGRARHIGPRGSTVKAIQPGPTETEINRDENLRARLRPMMAIGRMGKDTEVASLVAYLAGPESSFITGAALNVDGGYLA
jgi:3-oxoacyl-[acyl-carrier protein] reductase